MSLGVHLIGKSITLQTSNRPLRDALVDCVTARWRVPRVTREGIQFDVRKSVMVDSFEPFNVSRTLGVRIVKTALERRHHVEVVGPFKQTEFAPRDLDRPEFIKNVMRALRLHGYGQTLWPSHADAIEFAAERFCALPTMEMAVVVRNRRDAERFVRAVRRRRKQEVVRIGLQTVAEYPHRGVLFGSSASLDSADINFDLVMACGAECLLTAATREFHDLIRAPVIALRTPRERLCAADELLLERIAGPWLAS